MSSLRILILEPSVDLRRLYARHLLKMGHVAVVVDVERPFEPIDNLAAVVVDPSNADCCRAATEQQDAYSTPVVVITAHPPDAHPIDRSAYFQQPIRYDELAGAINALPHPA